VVDKFIPTSKYKVTLDYEGSRLDNCLLSRIKGLPRTKVYSIIRRGEVRVNGSRCKPSQRLKKGDEIRIPPHFLLRPVNLNINLKIKKKIAENIIYEDKTLLVIDKPVGLASHGGSGISSGLIEAVRKIKPQYKKAHLVHRLDKDTSGCIVIALRLSTLRELHKELRSGHVEKLYLAIVNGAWPQSLTEIESYLKKNILKSGQREVQVSKEGKKSKSIFRVIRNQNDMSLVECKILTGRTHQIRVHSSNAGFPILGDYKYGDKETNKIMKSKGLNRMLLHAKKISFPRLDLTFSAKDPPLFTKILSK